MKRIILILITLVAMIGAAPHSADAKSNFVEIRLPNGISVDIPRNWKVLTKDRMITFDTTVEAQLNLSNLPMPSSDLGFVAVYLDDSGDKAKVNVRYYPDMAVTQDKVLQATAEEVRQFDKLLKQSIDAGAKSTGATISYWGGTRKQGASGKMALITEYRRPPYPGEHGSFNVRLIRVLDGPKSFTLTVSYNELYAVIFKPVSDRIIASLKIRN